jgi:hypothetical protein
MIEQPALIEHPAIRQSLQVPRRVYRVGRAEIRPTELFSYLWYFAAERQRILFARIDGRPAPWTSDPILQRYRFTNSYRIADRVSQFLLTHVIYDEPHEVDEIVFRVLLFKLFNKIETWKLLEENLGPLTPSRYSFAEYDRVLSDALESGQRIYSSAYIVPNPPFGEHRKHGNHLRLIEAMMNDGIASKVCGADTLHDVFQALIAYPSLGPFLAFQLAVDLAYSEVLACSESEFVVPGPGALDGLSKCFADVGQFSGRDVIMWMTDTAREHFDALDIEFPTLYGRDLQPVDIQNLLCEISKYSRVSHPHLAGRSGRTRIKQEFRARQEPVSIRLPPKWGLSPVTDACSSPRTVVG